MSALASCSGCSKIQRLCHCVRDRRCCPAWAIEVVVPAHKHPVKTVAVVVAAKDLQLGTPFTADNIDQLTAIVEVPCSELPNYVRSKEEPCWTSDARRGPSWRDFSCH
ncbi:MAG: hypothetical protein U0792_04535 [Gemmataceae bacterium]